MHVELFFTTTHILCTHCIVYSFHLFLGTPPWKKKIFDVFSDRVAIEFLKFFRADELFDLTNGG